MYELNDLEGPWLTETKVAIISRSWGMEGMEELGLLLLNIQTCHNDLLFNVFLYIIFFICLVVIFIIYFSY